MSLCTNLAVTIFNVVLILTTLPAYVVAQMAQWCACCKDITDKSCRRRAVFVLCCLGWRALFAFCCCWIRFDVDGLEEFRSSLSSTDGPCVIVANHTSFLDTILLVSLMPVSKIHKVKMFVSAHLTKMPVLGTIVKTMGHLAVPFKAKSSDSNSMELDKDLMAERQQLLEEHVRAGGIGGWFPEGRINPGDTSRVLPFRAGGFALPARVDVPIWCVSFRGNDVCWPRDSAVGGRPCRIRIEISQLCASSQALAEELRQRSVAAQAQAASGSGAQSGGERQAAILLANHAHARVQAAVRELDEELRALAVDEDSESSSDAGESSMDKALLNDRL